MASVVIRTRNEEKLLGQVLQALDQQQPRPLEVIVIDSGSSDSTVEIARRWNASLLHIPAQEFTFGRALNTGIRAAQDDVVAILSGHSVPCSTEWLARITWPLQLDRGVAGVYGRQVDHAGATFLDWLIKRYLGLDDQRAAVFSGFETPWFSNANACVRRSVALAIPFDEAVTGGEDRIWAAAVQAQGWRTVYEPGAAVWHSHGTTLGGIWDRLRRGLAPLSSSAQP